MNWLRRKFRLVPPAEPLRAKVTPDPYAAESLEERRRALSYKPRVPFHANRVAARRSGK